MQAMIFAAGLGTRLLEETKDKPKALVEIGGKTLLQNAIEKLINEGASKIVINVHHFSGLVKSFLSNTYFDVPVLLSDESENLLDTGGGLKNAENLFDQNLPIVLYNVDIISNIDLKSVLDVHNKSEALATLVVRNRATQRYLKFDGSKRLVGWTNIKTGENKISIPENFADATKMAFSGIHIVQPEIFKLMPKAGKYSIIQVYLELAKTQLIQGFYDNSDLWIDVGKPQQLEQARRLF